MDGWMDGRSCWSLQGSSDVITLVPPESDRCVLTPKRPRVWVRFPASDSLPRFWSGSYCSHFFCPRFDVCCSSLWGTQVQRWRWLLRERFEKMFWRTLKMRWSSVYSQLRPVMRMWVNWVDETAVRCHYRVSVNEELPPMTSVAETCEMCHNWLVFMAYIIKTTRFCLNVNTSRCSL